MQQPFDTRFFLGEMPEGNYQQYVERTQKPERRRYFSTLFSDIQKEYNKALAGYAAGNPGRNPAADPGLTTFSDFLKNFSFEDRFFEQAPWDRDRNYRDYNPRTRFEYNR